MKSVDKLKTPIYKLHYLKEVKLTFWATSIFRNIVGFSLADAKKALFVYRVGQRLCNFFFRLTNHWHYIVPFTSLIHLAFCHVLSGIASLIWKFLCSLFTVDLLRNVHVFVHVTQVRTIYLKKRSPNTTTNRTKKWVTIRKRCLDRTESGIMCFESGIWIWKC